MHTRTRSRARTQAELKSALSLEKAKAEHDAAWKARQEEEERWLPCLLMFYVCVAYILILIFILRHIHACYTRARTHTQSLSLTHTQTYRSLFKELLENSDSLAGYVHEMQVNMHTCDICATQVVSVIARMCGFSCVSISKTVYLDLYSHLCLLETPARTHGTHAHAHTHTHEQSRMAVINSSFFDGMPQPEQFAPPGTGDSQNGGSNAVADQYFLA